MRETAENWAEFGDCNVCIVDWSRLSHYSYRLTAKKHLKMVADASIQFMRFLMQHGMDIEHVTLAADSLSAHLAALIGQAFDGKLEAIISMDPAALGFTFPYDVGIDLRLDPTDAKYVQAIYTSQYMIGSSVDCGHANFYMNGGMIQVKRREIP